MRGASESWKAQQDATRREYDKAVADGHQKKAQDILIANPDMDFTTKETEA